MLAENKKNISRACRETDEKCGHFQPLDKLEEYESRIVIYKGRVDTPLFFCYLSPFDSTKHKEVLYVECWKTGRSLRKDVSHTTDRNTIAVAAFAREQGDEGHAAHAGVGRWVHVSCFA